jgi:hypothetical protein
MAQKLAENCPPPPILHEKLCSFIEDYASLFDLHEAFSGALIQWALCSSTEDYASLFDLHQAFWGAFVGWALCSFIEDCTSLFNLHQAFGGAFVEWGIMFFHGGLRIFVQPSSSIFGSLRRVGLCNTHPWVEEFPNERTGPRPPAGLGGP